jgi:hypothetical protein
VKSINSDISEIKTLLHTLIGRENHGDWGNNTRRTSYWF